MHAFFHAAPEAFEGRAVLSNLFSIYSRSKQIVLRRKQAIKPVLFAYENKDAQKSVSYAHNLILVFTLKTNSMCSTLSVHHHIDG